jgi:hypothetical protein
MQVDRNKGLHITKATKYIESRKKTISVISVQQFEKNVSQPVVIIICTVTCDVNNGYHILF